MKNLKFVISVIILVVVLSMSFCFAAMIPKDVKDTKYELPVDILIELGVVNAYPDGTYLPNNTVTKADFVKKLVVAYGLEPAAEVSKGETAFNDVTAAHWASGYINIAREYDLININLEKNMCSDSTCDLETCFHPDRNITYKEAITYCLRTLGYANEIDSKGTWPTNYVAKATDLKLIKNLEYASYNDEMTKGEEAILLWNMLQTNMWRISSEEEDNGLISTPTQTFLQTKFLDGQEIVEEVLQSYEKEKFELVGLESHVVKDGEIYSIEILGESGSITSYNFASSMDEVAESLWIRDDISGSVAFIEFNSDDEIVDLILLARASESTTDINTTLTENERIDRFGSEEYDYYSSRVVKGATYDWDNSRIVDSSDNVVARVTANTVNVVLTYNSQGTQNTSDDTYTVELKDDLTNVEDLYKDDILIVCSDNGVITVAEYVITFEVQEGIDYYFGIVDEIDINAINSAHYDIQFDGEEDSITAKITGENLDLLDSKVIAYTLEENKKGEVFLIYVSGLTQTDLMANNNLIYVSKVKDDRTVAFSDGTKVILDTEEIRDYFDGYKFALVEVVEQDGSTELFEAYNAEELWYEDISLEKYDRIKIDETNKVMFIIRGLGEPTDGLTIPEITITNRVQKYGNVSAITYDITPDVTDGTVKVEYEVNGVYGTALPTNAGIYKVRVSLTGDSNLEDTTKEVTMMIEEAEPKITISNLVQDDYDISAITYSIQPEVTNGTVKVEYEVDGVYGTALPTQVGTYNVRVSVTNDRNLKNFVQEDILIIESCIKERFKLVGLESHVVKDGEIYSIEILEESGSTTSYNFASSMDEVAESLWIRDDISGSVAFIEFNSDDEIVDLILLARASESTQDINTTLTENERIDRFGSGEYDYYSSRVVERALYDVNNSRIVDSSDNVVAKITNNTINVVLIYNTQGTNDTSDDTYTVEFTDDLTNLEDIYNKDILVVCSDDGVFTVAEYVITFEVQEGIDYYFGIVDEIDINAINSAHYDIQFDGEEDSITAKITGENLDLLDSKVIAYTLEENKKGEVFLIYVSGLTQTDLMANNNLIYVSKTDGDRTVEFSNERSCELDTEEIRDYFDGYKFALVEVVEQDGSTELFEAYNVEELWYEDISLEKFDRIKIDETNKVMFIIRGLGEPTEGLTIPEITITNRVQKYGNVSAITYDITPAVTDGTVTVEYEVNGVYGTALPTNAGIYKVRVSLTGDSNLEDATKEVTMMIEKASIGDSNLDGEINSTDLQRLYSHLNGSNVITNANQLELADVNDDGVVNSTDLQRLYSHLNGSNPLK